MKAKNLLIASAETDRYLVTPEQNDFLEIMNTLSESGELFNVFIDGKYVGSIEENALIHYETGEVTSFTKLMLMIKWEE